MQKLKKWNFHLYRSERRVICKTRTCLCCVVSESRTRRKRNNLKNNTNFLIKCWKFVSKNRWNELCPFHEITGFTLTLLEKVPRTQNSEEKFQESRPISRANPETGASPRTLCFYYVDSCETPGVCCCVLLTRGSPVRRVLFCFIDPRLRKIRNEASSVCVALFYWPEGEED